MCNCTSPRNISRGREISGLGATSIRLNVEVQLLTFIQGAQAGGFDSIPEGASISEMVYVRLSGNEPPGEASVLNLSRGARRNAP